MSAEAVGKIALIAGGAVLASCVVGPTMYFYNRNSVKTSYATGQKNGAAAEKARQEELRRQENVNTRVLSAEVEENRRMFKISLALVSVGYACAASFGEVTHEDKVNIEEYILGISRYVTPQHMRLKMEQIAKAPPDVKTAFTHAATIATAETWRHFDELVNVMMVLKAVASGEPSGFNAEWTYLRRTA